ncbi:HTH-type transcriptional regulator MalT [compost metagenome]
MPAPQSHSTAGAPLSQRLQTGAGRTPAIKYAAPATGAGHLARVRLIEQIDRATTARLILIRAAAGFGKTTLLQQYREHRLEQGKPTIWINLDAGDNDLQRFVAALGDGLRQLLGTDQPTRDSHDLLDLVMTCETPFGLLFDEFEVIHDQDVLDLVQQLLDALPSGCVMALTSRSVPGIGLGRIRARGQLLEIRPADLRFTYEETQAFLHDKRLLPLRDNEIHTLYRCTEGWITGLYLASLSLSGRDDHAAFIASFSGSNLELAEYLTEDILARQSVECRDFLLQSSIPGQFCASLCDALTGRSDSEAMIGQLERANLFISPVGSQQQWFRYHPLFASFLRDALKRQHPGRSEQLHEVAALWFLQAQQPIPAIDHLFQAGRLDEAAARIDEHLDTLVDSARSRLLLRWLDSIPGQTLDGYPSLGLTYAWLLAMSSRQQDAMRVAERLERQSAGHAYVPLAIRCMYLGMTDQVDECCRLGLEVLERMPDKDCHLYVALAHTVASALMSSGRHEEAQLLIPSAMQREKRLGGGFMGYGFGAIQAVLDLIQGRLNSAFTRLTGMRDTPRPDRLGGHHGAPLIVDVLLGLVHYERGELEEAEKRLARSLPFAKHVSSPDVVIASHVLSARLACLRGDRQGWLRHLVDLQQLGEQSGSQRVRCASWVERLRVATLDRQLDNAAQALRNAELDADWDRPNFTKFGTDGDTPGIARQRLRIAQGEFRAAAKALRQALEHALHWQHQRRALKLRLLLALALDGQGQEQEAFEELTQALQLASHEGFVMSIVEEGEPMAALLQRWTAQQRARCRELRIEAGFVDELLRRLGVNSGAPAASPSAATTTQHQLTEREFQVLRLLADGYRNKAIAEKIFLSEFTVKSHLQKIYAKLEVNGRTEALASARARGWIE